MARNRNRQVFPTYLDQSMDRTLRSLLQGGASADELDLFHAEVRAKCEAAPARIDRCIEELRSLLEGLDGLDLLGCIDTLDARRRTMLSGGQNFGSDAMVEFLAGLVVSTEPSVIQRNLGRRAPLRVIHGVDMVLREIANQREFMDLGLQLRRGGVDELTDMTTLLLLENNFDRMSGFDQQVLQVTRAVFAAVDDRVLARLGFALSDALTFAQVYNRERVAHTNRAQSAQPPPSAADDTVAAQRAEQTEHGWLHAMAAPLETWVEPRFATAVGVTTERLHALLEAVGTRVGSVTADVTQDNPTRLRPVLLLGTTGWMWSRPVDFNQVALEWGAAVCSTDPGLMAAFDKARHRVTERLTAESLRGVFGVDRVTSNVRYPAQESDAEVDVLVRLPGVVLVVECKGGRFSREGRRAAPQRVRRHIKDIVEKGREQNRRATSAIRAGEPFTDPSGGRVHLDADAVVIPIVVMLDRVDAFAAYLSSNALHPPPANPAGARGASFPAESDSDMSWIVSLTDLLMMTDVLPTPSQFVPYVVARRRLTRDGTVVWVEADAVGGWCENRLTKLQEQPDFVTGGTKKAVGDVSAWMNDHYTMAALRAITGQEQAADWYAEQCVRTDKPHVQVPAAVLASLDTLVAAENEGWLTVVRDAMDVPVDSWRPLKRALAEAATGSEPRTREQRRRRRNLATGFAVGGLVRIVRIANGTLTVRSESRSDPARNPEPE